ncbi:aldehyde dehydrogenase family protein [Mucilaginibacter gilvus]|uniref:Aldehyde dehydrogenase family protein n=1 Tax=Mucilaginibacter gilvus TaxID=2305909 RepID=A0A444MHE8_9SPHI|nr:aldehyde dehydrogenase family protein [Mucilaginibacter gilvus]RWY46078.1 aldehyde dehydrogenase family protein [Mucilaginibacter gilvus]
MKTAKLNLINNEWVDSGDHQESINPATGEVIGTWANATSKNVASAINVAVKTFKESAWKDDRHLRAKALNEMADLFEAYTERLIDILSLENGKLKGEAAFEVSMCPAKLRYYASLTLTSSGRALETSPGSFSMVVSQPIGVAGIIAPWNSPVVLLIRSLAPALAAGCTTVIKMPAPTALVNAMLSEIFKSTKSLPAGVINLFTEAAGGEGSHMLIMSKDIPTISYTGSTKVGKILMSDMSQNLKRFGFELGGKTPMLVFNDVDLDRALPILEKAITVFAGQFCMTGSRILVQSGIAERLKSELGKRLAAVKVGPASDPSSDMGPIIDKPNVMRINKVVDEAIAAGAKVIVRGGPATDGALSKGAFYRPTLLEVNDNSMSIVQEETFGPVATIQVFNTEAEAIALANDNIYGLAASVWSSNVDLPLRVARELDAGTVWINDWAQINDEFEEGGFKQSGPRRLNGEAAMDDFLEIKHIYHNAGIVSR